MLSLNGGVQSEHLLRFAFMVSRKVAITATFARNNALIGKVGYGKEIHLPVRY